MNWFANHRQEWIAETLRVFGFINRQHLMRKFGVSKPQASADLTEFQREHPDAMVYDKKRKCYVAGLFFPRTTADQANAGHQGRQPACVGHPCPTPAG